MKITFWWSSKLDHHLEVCTERLVTRHAVRETNTYLYAYSYRRWQNAGNRNVKPTELDDSIVLSNNQ